MTISSPATSARTAVPTIGASRRQFRHPGEGRPDGGPLGGEGGGPEPAPDEDPESGPEGGPDGGPDCGGELIGSPFRRRPGEARRQADVPSFLPRFATSRNSSRS
ncbi:hypothetical protein [Kitasatospora sp. NPDC057015]|uniref:hypothetical protein n=1 Tax=Kitasatospora sp. NPDC057015 TaxID=3346001 RepID=UPI00363D2595